MIQISPCLRKLKQMQIQKVEKFIEFRKKTNLLQKQNLIVTLVAGKIKSRVIPLAMLKFSSQFRFSPFMVMLLVSMIRISIRAIICIPIDVRRESSSG